MIWLLIGCSINVQPIKPACLLTQPLTMTATHKFLFLAVTAAATAASAAVAAVSAAVAVAHALAIGKFVLD